MEVMRETEELAKTLYLTEDGSSKETVSYEDLEQWVQCMYEQQAQRIINCGFGKIR
jgi:hypothetical protein